MPTSTPRLPPGSCSAGNIATHTAMNFIAAGLPIKIVALLDVSKTADAMISDGSVTDIKGLKGKQVAYEEGTTSDILLNYALAQNGMTIADIEKVPMPASDAGAALIGGKVPVAVTYEPYLTLAMQQNQGVKMIYCAGENPGLISDVFVVREELLAEKPGQVVALLKAWDVALADYRKDTAGGRAIIAEAVGAKPEELATAFDGVVYYSLAENKTEFAGNFTSKVIPRGAQGRAQGRHPAEGCRPLHRRSTVASWMPRPSSGETRRRLHARAGGSPRREFLGIAALVVRACSGSPGLAFTATGPGGPLFLPSPGQVVSRLGELCGVRPARSPMSASASTGSRSAF